MTWKSTIASLTAIGVAATAAHAQGTPPAAKPKKP
jgi:hypothetical protein